MPRHGACSQVGPAPCTQPHVATNRAHKHSPQTRPTHMPHEHVTHTKTDSGGRRQNCVLFFLRGLGGRRQDCGDGLERHTRLLQCRGDKGGVEGGVLLCGVDVPAAHHLVAAKGKSREGHLGHLSPPHEHKAPLVTKKKSSTHSQKVDSGVI